MATQIDNADLTTAGAGIEGPFGPLTRVGDAADIQFNSDIPVEFTSALGLSVEYSYDELLDTNTVYLDLIRKHSVRSYNSTAILFGALSEAIGQLWQGFVDPFQPTDVEQRELIRLAQTAREIVGTLPNSSHDPADIVRIVTLTSDVTGDPVAELTLVAENDDYVLVDWGDGTEMELFDPTDTIDHTYTANDTFTITVYVFGAARPNADVRQVEAVIAAVV